jgi:hypothetical protein
MRQPLDPTKRQSSENAKDDEKQQLKNQPEMND